MFHMQFKIITNFVPQIQITIWTRITTIEKFTLNSVDKDFQCLRGFPLSTKKSETNFVLNLSKHLYCGPSTGILSIN